jgi:hypothetical protein
MFLIIYSGGDILKDFLNDRRLWRRKWTTYTWQDYKQGEYHLRRLFHFIRDSFLGIVSCVKFVNDRHPYLQYVHFFYF